MKRKLIDRPFLQIMVTDQRNLRNVVSVGVSTESVRLEFEGPHA